MKETVLHVRINEDIKTECETLFASMGTNLSESVRIFLTQCILEQRLPFPVKSYRGKGTNEAYGFLNLYAKPTAQREQEREAWITSLAKKK